jgi:DNA-binding response OmpR family regulator
MIGFIWRKRRISIVCYFSLFNIPLPFFALNMRIAVLDDDPAQTDLMRQVLTSAGHECLSFRNGKDMLHLLRRDNVDMLILDWQIADRSAPEVLHWTREQLPATLPVLFMTGRAGEEDIITGLAAGADDYMIKPIRRGELVARVQALLRRAYPDQRSAGQIRFGDYVFEGSTARVTINGTPVEVTQKEFELALLFFRNLGKPLSRAYILESVWSQEPEVPSRTMDTHVSRVRNKLQLRPENGFRLAPVYSFGYQLVQVPPG